MRRIKIIVAAVLVTTGTTLFAQDQIPNSDFENWALDAENNDSLVGWSSSNGDVISPLVSLIKGTSPYTGSSAAELITAPFGFAQYSTVGVMVNGEGTFSWGGGGGGSNVDLASGGGTPIWVKPDSITGFYYKTATNAFDMGVLKVLSSRFNTTTQQRDTVSYEEHFFQVTGLYTPFSVVLNDLLPGVMPDTITTVFYSSDPNTVGTFGEWSNLVIDDIEIHSTLSSASVITPDHASLNMYPNPTNDVVSVYSETALEGIVLLDCSGREVLRRNEKATSYTFNVNKLPDGVYFLKANTGGAFKSVKKLVISGS